MTRSVSVHWKHVAYLRHQEESSLYTVDNLPVDPIDILQRLDQDDQPIQKYLDIGLLYYYRGDHLSYKRVLQAGSDSVKGKSPYDGQNEEHIALIASMTGYYLQVAMSLNLNIKDLPSRNQVYSQVSALLDEAVLMINEADQIDSGQTAISFCKGILFLLKRDILLRKDFQYNEDVEELLKSAKQQFQYILDKDPFYIPCLLGKGWAAFESYNYLEALHTYQKILRLWPDSPKDIRFAMGICYFKLGYEDYARICFERVLAMDPHDINALTGLTVLDINRSLGDSKINDSAKNSILERISSIYKTDKNQNDALLHLGKHFFEKGDLVKTEAISLTLFVSNTLSARFKAEVCFLLGKVYHVNNAFDESLRYYSQAVRYDPKFSPALYALSQVHVHKGEYTTACELLERLIQLQPDAAEGRVLLGTLYVSLAFQEKGEKARTLEKKALGHLEPLPDTDIEGSLLAATLLEQTETENALCRYWNIISKLKAASIPVPIELLNNAAVLYIILKQPEKAYTLLKDAIAQAENESKSNANLIVTIAFNLGRSYESLGLFDNARIHYNQVLSLDPTYWQATLRLGVLFFKEERIDEAMDIYKDVAAQYPEMKEPWLLLAEIQIANKALTPARKTLERVLMQIDKHDVYSLLCLGQVYTTLARRADSRRADYNTSFQTYIIRAAEFFNKCLLLDARNVYAIHGMAILAAMKGQFMIARDVLMALKHMWPSSIDIHLNLAHSYLLQGQASPAIHLYEHVEKRLLNYSVAGQLMGPVLIYLSKALYVFGKTMGQSGILRRCIQCLEKALLLQPYDDALRFNLALAQQEFAVTILSLDINVRSFEDVMTAMDYLQVSSLMFDVLADQGGIDQSAKCPFDPKVARSRSKYGHSLKTNILKQYQKQREDELNRHVLLDQLRLQRLQEEKLNEQVRLENIQREEELRLENERLFLENQEKVKAVFAVESQPFESSAKPSKTRHKKIRKNRRVTAFDDSEESSTDLGTNNINRLSIQEDHADTVSKHVNPTNKPPYSDNEEGTVHESKFMDATVQPDSKVGLTNDLSPEDFSDLFNESESENRQQDSMDPVDTYLNLDEAI